MLTGKDIFESIGKDRPSVPEGYFTDLKARLGSIPERSIVRQGPWSSVRPYLALAASFVAIAVISTASEPVPLSGLYASPSIMIPMHVHTTIAIRSPATGGR